MRHHFRELFRLRDRETAEPIAVADGKSLQRLSRVGRKFGLCLLGTAGLTVLYYAASVHAFSGNSDGATVVLEGAAIHHGNLTLSNWSLSLDSFWTVDVLFYAVAVAIGGVRSSYMHLVPALLAALSVVVGSLIVTRGYALRGRIVAISTIVVVLVLPSHALAFFLLQGPWHVGTVLYCLVAMAMLRNNRFGWSWFVGVVLLAAGLLGDLQALAIGVVPVFCAGAIAAARSRSIRSGLWTALAAPAAIVLAVVVRLLALATGTFRVSESHHTVSLVQVEANVSNFMNWFSALLGIHQGAFGGPTIPRLLEIPRLLVAAALVVAVLVASFGALRGVIVGRENRDSSDSEWRTDDLLLLGLIGSVGVFGVLTLSNNVSYARYLDAVMIFGTLLTARVLARWSTRVSVSVLTIAAVLGCLTIGTSAATLAIDLAAARPPAPTAPLEQFLAVHGLHDGIGDYWAASVVTVDTRGSIRIRPVVANLTGTLVRDGRQASSKWYHGKKFSFLVYDKDPYGRVEATTVVKTFGPPAASYVVGRYTVDVWSHPLSLGPTSFP
jgi:hypothetical protein